MALDQFMPYGAPELLADQDRRTSRAVASATALLATCFGALVLFLPRTPIAALAPAEFPDSVFVMIAPPPLDPGGSPPQVAPSPPTTPIEHAVPQPVPDEIAPPDDVVPPLAQGGGESGEQGGDPAPGGDGAGIEITPRPGHEGEPVDLVMVDVLPALVSSPDVHYPDLAREAGVEGRVLVRILVGRDGRVKDAVVDPKFSVPLLDAAALAAARASVFTPATTNGHAVSVWVARPYEFRLH